MRKEIRYIKVVAKYGAFGRSDAMGIYIYGKRRDGKTVPCKSEVQTDGNIQIWSSYHTGGQFCEEDMTGFSKEEWDLIRRADGADGADGADATRIANQIIDKR